MLNLLTYGQTLRADPPFEIFRYIDLTSRKCWVFGRIEGIVAIARHGGPATICCAKGEAFKEWSNEVGLRVIFGKNGRIIFKTFMKILTLETLI